MKIWVFILGLFISVTSFSQEIEVDYVSPFHGDMAAVQKGDQWGFINEKGEMVLEYRSDLVASQNDGDQSYPAFVSGRALIKKMKEGIWHYGYIDTKGEPIIDAVYVNATDFKDGHAIVLKVNKETLGRNEVLGKDVIAYSYNEVVIDAQGELVAFLRGPVNLQYDKEFLKENPKIQSKFLSDKLVATKEETKGWVLHPIKGRM